MPRIAFFEKQEPIQVGDKHVCQCGLSGNFPFCDASHDKTKDEEKLKVYQYMGGERMVVGELHQHGSCGCGECHGGEDEDGHCECGCEHEHHEEEEE